MDEGPASTDDGGNFGKPTNSDRPDQPGQVPLIAYCLGVQSTRIGFELILAYTSSGRWRPPMPAVPVGVIEFDRAAASVLNQKSFHLDLRVLSRVPPGLSWLPRLEAPESGIIAQADRGLRDRINAVAERLVRRPEVIQIRGVGSLPVG